MFFFTDRAELADVQVVGEHLHVNARVARGGNVQEYLGSEMGVTDKAVVRVYRPADEVFDKASMATFPHKVVTLGHPKGRAVFERDGVGWMGDEVARDGEYIRVPMVVAHKKAVDAVRNKDAVELSVGYATQIVWGDGVSPSGEQYDAKMTQIVVDHVAIVKAARGGPSLRIGDWHTAGASDSVPNPKGDRSMTTLTLDGISVEMADAKDAANIKAVFDKLSKQIADQAAADAKAQAAHGAAIAAKDAELAKRDAEIDALKGKVVDEAALDARVAARADLIALAGVIAPDVKTAGLSDAAIRKAVVTAKLGDAAVTGKADAYIDARFDILAEDAKAEKPDAFRAVAKDGLRPADGDNKAVTDAYAAMLADIKSGKAANAQAN